MVKKVEHTPTIIAFIRCNGLFLILISTTMMIATIKSFYSLCGIGQVAQLQTLTDKLYS